MNLGVYNGYRNGVEIRGNFIVGFDGQKDKLFELCFKFIQEQKITCGECVYQSDGVDAYELIEEICEIVGYYKDE